MSIHFAKQMGNTHGGFHKCTCILICFTLLALGGLTHCLWKCKALESYKRHVIAILENDCSNKIEIQIEYHTPRNRQSDILEIDSDHLLNTSAVIVLKMLQGRCSRFLVN